MRKPTPSARRSEPGGDRWATPADAARLCPPVSATDLRRWAAAPCVGTGRRLRTRPDPAHAGWRLYLLADVRALAAAMRARRPARERQFADPDGTVWVRREAAEARYGVAWLTLRRWEREGRVKVLRLWGNSLGLLQAYYRERDLDRLVAEKDRDANAVDPRWATVEQAVREYGVSRPTLMAYTDHTGRPHPLLGRPFRTRWAERVDRAGRLHQIRLFARADLRKIRSCAGRGRERGTPRTASVTHEGGTLTSRAADQIPSPQHRTAGTGLTGGRGTRPDVALQSK